MVVNKNIQIFIRAIFIPFLLILDYIIPKKKELWVFPVGGNKQWIGNSRSLFEFAKESKKIVPIILAYESIDEVPPQDHTYTVLTKNIKGLFYLIRSSVIVIHHGTGDYCWKGISKRRHIIFNVWHGIPLKGIGVMDKKSSEKEVIKETSQYTVTIASSKVDKLAMCTCFKLSYSKVVDTGLPRNDWLLLKHEELPTDLQKMEKDLKAKLAGKKLVLYAPTFRQQKDKNYSFNNYEIGYLENLLEANNAILGIRSHINSLSKSNINSPFIVEINQNEFYESQIVLRITDVLITDYSSVWYDYLLMDKPVIAFCYDWDQYMREREILYDYELMFPGEITHNTNELMEALEKVLINNISDEYKSKYQNTKLMFHKYDDGNSSKRVIDNILELQRLS